MKNLILFVCFVMLALKVSAQEVPEVKFDVKTLGKNIDLKDVASHVGELVNLCDSVHYYKVPGDSLILFCMGGRYPHQQLTIVAKDPNAVFSIANWIGDPMCVYGVVRIKEGKPQLVVSGPDCMLFYSYPKIR